MAPGATTAALKPAGPATSPGAAARPASSFDEEYEYDEEEGGLLPFAVIVLILAVVVLIIEVLTKMSGS